MLHVCIRRGRLNSGRRESCACRTHDVLVQLLAHLHGLAEFQSCIFVNRVAEPDVLHWFVIIT